MTRTARPDPPGGLDAPEDRSGPPREDGPAPSRAARLVPPALMLCVVGIVLYLSATSLVEQGAASGTPITNSALYPRLLAGLLLLLTLVQIARELAGRGGPVDAPRITRLAALQVAGGGVAVVAYLALLPVAGYLVATTALVAGLLVLFGDRSPLRILLYTAGLTVGCAAAFQGLFNVNLPRGVLGLALPF